MARDITERKEAERQIEQLAFFDPLTRLPNRRLLNDRLHSIIERVERDNLTGALLFIDLDDFKRINDSLGHSVGDALLTLVAERLKPIMRECDTIARLGGDEFVIILENLKHNKNAVCDEAATVAQKLLDSFLNTFKLGNSEYKISISIGISLIEDQHTSAEEVLMRADTAMYRAKKLGGDIYAFYEPEMQDAIDTRLRIEGEITHAIQQEQFTVFFQPQVDHQGQPIGAEALIRWLHPDKGLISPEHFIPVAEQSGLILALQNIVVTHVCQLIVKLEQNPRLSETFSVAINISPSQFKSRQLEKSILPILDQFKLSTNRFKLEITESMLMNNIEDTINQMEYLKDRGFRFSIDDFGTGYSSLAYLHAFPIDELKIDKTFIDKITEEKGGTAIVDAIIALSNHLQFHVIAEGVETQCQATLLSDRQIKGIQGYFFAKPMNVDDVIAWIEQKLPVH
jgi:diguanylate cyclase (GGDEF)-like protein